MPPKRRKAPEVQTTYCDVELSQQLSHEAAAALAQDVCKHILFMRNQIPMLYKELRDNAEESSAAATKGKRLGKHRKADKFIGAAENLLSSISPELFASSHGTEIVFLLGPSPMRALEVYSMTCSTNRSASENNEHDSQQALGSYMATASRVVLRKLILATAAGTEGPASKGATKLSVLVRRPADAECPPGFLPKRGLEIRMPKGLQVKICVRGPGQGSPDKDQSTQRMADSQASQMSWSQAGGCCAQQDPDDCPGDEEGKNDAPEDIDTVQQPEGVGSRDHIWYQSTISLQGITQVSSQPMDVGGFM